ncbi:TRAP transporter small permease [Marinicauda algicola]|uniref:TRAP transporter small permease protein n=1 Tax=Marinicauda algicola TaxID=2029849 RepID=A0A4S2H3U3_9PROT|nr:TRAP transporter small permease [Marinicauda algicola]TGY90193.1 TRAP transporter small permease [Marinicauda algicola]
MSGLLKALSRFERTVCIIAFAVMAIALMADVVSRRLFATGLIGATEVAVYGMIAVAMFGIGIATDAGAHLRPRFLDAIFPRAWRDGVQRLAYATTALFFAIFAGLSAWMVAESFVLGDRTEILRAPVWALQSMILVGFATNMLRFAVYAARPGLAPRDEVEAALEDIREEGA